MNDTPDQASPDPRTALMRDTKPELVDRVLELQSAGEQLIEERDGARQARRSAIQTRDEHAEGLALSRVLNALEHLEGGRSADRGRTLAVHHWTGPASPDPYVPSPAERILRHAWMAAGLPDPSAETDRLREELRFTRVQLANAEDRLARVRELGAGEEPSY